MKRFTKFVTETVEQTKLDEAVEVRHDRYMRSHGKKAGAGYGMWMFTHKDRGDVDYKDEKQVHTVTGNFGDAKKSAQQWGKKHGHSAVYVMEEVELDEAAPKMKSDFIKIQREKDKAHADATGRHVKSGRKKTITSTQRSLASMRNEEVELDEVSDKMLDRYRQKAFADQPSGDDGSDKYRKRKFGRDLAFAKQTGRAKVLATKEEVELDETRSWFDPSDHEQFKNMTPEQKKARHDSLMKLATTHKNYDIRSFAKSAANELKSKYMKEEAELDEANKNIIPDRELNNLVKSKKAVYWRSSGFDKLPNDRFFYIPILDKNKKMLGVYKANANDSDQEYEYLDSMLRDVREEVELDEVSSELAQRVYKKRMDQSSAALKRDDYAGMRKAEKKAGETHSRMIKKILRREEVELDEGLNQPWHKKDIEHSKAQELVAKQKEKTMKAKNAANKEFTKGAKIDAERARQERQVTLNRVAKEDTQNHSVDIKSESVEMSMNQRKALEIGRKLQVMATKEKNDTIANAMANLGDHLESFGASFGAKNMNDLVKKTGLSKEAITMLIQRAQRQ